MPDNPELTFHGAARTVTGSCATIELGDARILVDCGMFQGSRSLEKLNVAEFAFAPESIDAVILTHAHIDHCGLLPKLVARGFEGHIFCTAPTAELLSFMLADSARIQEFEAQRRNRRRDRSCLGRRGRGNPGRHPRCGRRWRCWRGDLRRNALTRSASTFVRMQKWGQALQPAPFSYPTLTTERCFQRKAPKHLKTLEESGGSDGARTRDLRRDRPAL